MSNVLSKVYQKRNANIFTIVEYRKHPCIRGVVELILSISVNLFPSFSELRRSFNDDCHEISFMYFPMSSSCRKTAALHPTGISLTFPCLVSP